MVFVGPQKIGKCAALGQHHHRGGYALSPWGVHVSASPFRRDVPFVEKRHERQGLPRRLRAHVCRNASKFRSSRTTAVRYQKANREMIIMNTLKRERRASKWRYRGQRETIQMSGVYMAEVVFVVVVIGSGVIGWCVLRGERIECEGVLKEWSGAGSREGSCAPVSAPNTHSTM